VTHPYRERPEEPARLREPSSLDVSTVAFGLCCALAGQALAGPGCALVATVVGVLLLLGSPRRL
jgi:hypothetical protein